MKNYPPQIIHHFTRTGAGRPVTVIKTPLPQPGVGDAIKVVMQQHGGDVKVFDTCCEFIFPEGSIHYELWPRLYCERFDVLFPDSYTIRQTRNRDGYSNLSFPLESFPEDIRKRYGTDDS